MEAQRLFGVLYLLWSLVVVEALRIHTQQMRFVCQHDIGLFPLAAVDIVQECRCLIYASVS